MTRSAGLLSIFAIGPTLLALQAGEHTGNLNELPEYQPHEAVFGSIRSFGSTLGGLMETWEKGFHKYQPGIQFDDRLITGEGAVAGLICGISDLGPSGREPNLTEMEAVYDTFPGGLLDLTVATGPYDVKTTWSILVFVNRNNPISRLTLNQLDGIFGAERTGGYQGYKWTPAAARGAAQDIRNWGQLGLVGEWADKPIRTYGYAPGGIASFFQQKVFGGAEKWNPNYREYVETGSKMVVTSEAGRKLTIEHMLAELSHDKYGIAWTGMPQAARFPGIKPLALAAHEGGPYVEPSLETVRQRTYPLARSVFIFLRNQPGHPVAPKLKEFLRYILSRQGQTSVARNGKYLPLTSEVCREQIKRLY